MEISGSKSIIQQEVVEQLLQEVTLKCSPNGETAMHHVNISTLGNSQNFGDLTVGRYFMNANSSSIRGIFGGGDPGPSTQ